MNSTNMWILISIEFIYILLTFHTKNIHTLRRMFHGMCSRKHDIHPEILAPVQLYLLLHLTFSGENSNTLEIFSLIKILVAHVKTFPDNIISHSQLGTEWWSLKFPISFSSNFIKRSLLPLPSIISVLLQCEDI